MVYENLNPQRALIWRIVHRHLPVAAFLGVIRYSAEVKHSIDREVANAGVTLDVRAIPGWYFQ